MSRTKRLTLTVFGLVAVFSFVAYKASRKIEASNSELSFHGNWTVAARPFMGRGYKERSVIVGGVVSSFKDGYVITKVGLKNNSSKPVRSVKLGWYVSSEETKESILQRGETLSILMPDDFSTGKYMPIKIPDLKFVDMSRSLVKGQALNGHFHIDVMVSEILYADGSKWTGDGAEPEISYVNTSSTGAPLHCPLTECVFNGFQYVCDGPIGGFQYCEVCGGGAECCNNNCDFPPLCNCS